MSAQNFKGDATELKFRASGEPLMDIVSAARDQFYNQAYQTDPFLLMLYDEKRMPFYNRIPRDAFAAFVKEALNQATVTGTFESFLFIMRSIFGELVDVFFDVTAPGKITIDINTPGRAEFTGILDVFESGAYVDYELIDDDLDNIIFEGVPGIATEYELNLLFDEIMPAGIFRTINLEISTRFYWISDDSGTDYEMVDDSLNPIIFDE